MVLKSLRFRSPKFKRWPKSPLFSSVLKQKELVVLKPEKLTKHVLVRKITEVLKKKYPSFRNEETDIISKLNKLDPSELRFVYQAYFTSTRHNFNMTNVSYGLRLINSPQEIKKQISSDNRDRAIDLRMAADEVRKSIPIDQIPIFEKVFYRVNHNIFSDYRFQCADNIEEILRRELEFELKKS